VLRQVERAAQLLGRHLTTRLGGGLTDLEAHVLFHLVHLAPGVSPTLRELHTALGVRPSTLTAVVDRLERQGLVERTPNPADRRSALVVPTARAARTIAEVTAALDGIEAAVAAAVEPADLAAFRKVLAALEEALQ
jgi:DNA-binding MarR family transcriptional regulator